MNKNKNMKKLIKNFFSVTPKEWVAIQAFCTAASAYLLTSYGQIEAVFGIQDGDLLKSICKYSAFVLLMVAGLAQFKTKKK